MKTLKAIQTILLIVAMAAIANAFEVKVATEVGPAAYMKWNMSDGPIGITLNSAGSADAPIGSVENAVVGAMNTWQGATGGLVTFQYMGQSSSAVRNSSDGINSIQWVESGWSYSSNILAITLYTYYIQDPPYFADADIIVNGQNYKWGVNVAQNGTVNDIQQVLTHEMGHLLGLSHTSMYNASLYPYLPAAVKHTISTDDKNGILFLYTNPQNTFRAVNPTPKSVYDGAMVSKGLPMPTVRWYTSGSGSYTLEFSDTAMFTKKVSINAGSASFYQLKGTQISQLLKLAPTTRKLFWRVCNGSVRTATQTLILKNV